MKKEYKLSRKSENLISIIMGFVGGAFITIVILMLEGKL